MLKARYEKRFIDASVYINIDLNLGSLTEYLQGLVDELIKGMTQGFIVIEFIKERPVLDSTVSEYLLSNLMLR